jgi:hypothetical protein
LEFDGAFEALARRLPSRLPALDDFIRSNEWIDLAGAAQRTIAKLERC